MSPQHKCPHSINVPTAVTMCPWHSRPCAFELHSPIPLPPPWQPHQTRTHVLSYGWGSWGLERVMPIVAQVEGVPWDSNPGIWARDQDSSLRTTSYPQVKQFYWRNESSDFKMWNAKGIKDLNIRPDTIKLLEENTGGTLFDINHSNILFDLRPRITTIKTQINQWDH